MVMPSEFFSLLYLSDLLESFVLNLTYVYSFFFLLINLYVMAGLVNYLFVANSSCFYKNILK
jgi:hypothetical protein